MLGGLLVVVPPVEVSANVGSEHLLHHVKCTGLHRARLLVLLISDLFVQAFDHGQGL